VIAPQKDSFVSLGTLYQQIDRSTRIGSTIDVISEEHLDAVACRRASQIGIDHIEHLPQ